MPLLRRRTHTGTVTTYRDEAGLWRWRLVALNGEIVATGESHTRRADAERAAKTARKCFERPRWEEA